MTGSTFLMSASSGYMDAAAAAAAAERDDGMSKENGCTDAAGFEVKLHVVSILIDDVTMGCTNIHFYQSSSQKILANSKMV